MAERDDEFLEWLDELERILMNDYGYSAEEAEEYTHGQPRVWREDFDNGDTPSQAAKHDFDAGRSQ